MRVVVSQYEGIDATPVLPLAAGVLVATLRADAEVAAATTLAVEVVRQPIAAAVAALARPDVLGLSLYPWNAAYALAVAAAARAAVPDALIVVGGPSVPRRPAQARAFLDAHPAVDVLVLAEGEVTFRELVRARLHGRDLAHLPGVVARAADGDHLVTAPPARVLDLAATGSPFLDGTFDELWARHRERFAMVLLETNRGCPFSCTYCAARMYNQLYDEAGAGEYGRRRSHDNVLAELHALRAAGRLGYVIFLDDTFTINHGWVREFCRRYGDELGAPFSLHARVETVNEKMLHQLAAAGCKMITYGVESGSERVRREIMDRQVTNQRFRDVFRWTREAGIMLTCNFMLGLPGETRADLQATLDLAEELEVLDFGYFVFYPYPGTALFKVCRDRGYLPDDYLTRPANHRASILTLPGLTNDDIAEYFDRFTALRRRMYLARTGEAPPDEQTAASDHVDQLAAAG